MVQIQEQEEEPQQQQQQYHPHRHRNQDQDHVVSITQPQQHQQRNQPSSSHTTTNKSLTSSEPPPQSTDSPNSPSSSISSDHTFHGFSPIKETPTTPPSPPIQALVPVVNRLVQDQPPDTTVTKTHPQPQSGFAASSEIPVPRRPKTAMFFTRLGFVLRFFQLLLCLVSFSVMAADKNRGWAVDSFDNYTEFRYSMSVNVMGFAYSALQVLYLLYQMTTGKKFGSQVRYSFDFSIDQILAYLLLSASSSAFTRVDDWISNWGSDEFPAMASASVGVSFVGFIAFALSSLISGYLLCTHRFT